MERMTVEEIEIEKVTEENKSVLRQLIELYEYDFSQYTQNDVNEHGFFGYKYFDHYWTEKDRYPFFIKIGGKLAGFVLVNQHCYISKDPTTKSIAEFFVMRKYRRKNAGKDVAKQIFNIFPGKWEVLQHGENEISKMFWINVISEYTNGEYEIQTAKTESWTGQGILFDNTNIVEKIF